MVILPWYWAQPQICDNLIIVKCLPVINPSIESEFAFILRLRNNFIWILSDVLKKKAQLYFNGNRERLPRQAPWLASPSTTFLRLLQVCRSPACCITLLYREVLQILLRHFENTNAFCLNKKTKLG